jgi:hypothetical protein
VEPAIPGARLPIPPAGDLTVDLHARRLKRRSKILISSPSGN